MPSVRIAGHVNWDVTLRVDRLPEPDGESAIRSQHQSGGGSAANVAAALAGLEIDASLIGSVGDDDTGVLARRELDAAGVSLDGLRIVADAETAVKYLLVDDDGEVAVLGNDGVNEAVTPESIDRRRIRSVDHVHLTGQRPATAEAIATTAHDAGVTVSVDPGRRLTDRDYSESLAVADIVFANDREHEALFDGAPEPAVPDQLVVVKCGGDGAVVRTPEETYSHQGFAVDPVDTTGAGDAFAAGFIATAVEAESPDAIDIDRALAYANACGALTAAGNGARTAPTRSELTSFLADRH